MLFAATRFSSRCLASILLAAAPLALPGDHEDPAIGFALKTPRDWKQVPLDPDDNYVVGSYLSDKKLFDTDEDGFTVEHQPTLRIIAFIHADADGIDVEKDEDDEDQIRVRVRAFDDYESYMDGTYRSGYYVDEVEESTHKGVPVTRLTIKVEKNVRVPLQIVTWIFHVEAGDVAVEFEYLEDSARKLKSTVSKTLKSFQEIERVASAGQTRLGSGTWLTLTAFEKMTPEQRAERLRQSQKRFFDQSRASLPDGWEAMEIDEIRVITNVDEKYVEDVVERMAAVREWLDENLKRIGNDGYARYPVLRFFKDQAEEDAFLSSTGVNLNSYEITTYHATSYDQIFENYWVNNQILNYWLFDRDRNYYLSMPPWLRQGLPTLLSLAPLKGKKLNLRPDQYGIEKDDVREALKGDYVFPLAELLTMTADEVGDLPREQQRFFATQSGAFLRYLFEGPGKRDKQTKEMIDDYLTALDGVFAAIDAEEEAEREARKKEREEKKAAAEAAGEEYEEDEPQTEEEEEAALRKRREAREAQRERISREAFQQVFGSWTESDWSGLDKSFLKYID